MSARCKRESHFNEGAADGRKGIKERNGGGGSGGGARAASAHVAETVPAGRAVGPGGERATTHGSAMRRAQRRASHYRPASEYIWIPRTARGPGRLHY
jgi:hypothetical protein